MTAVRTLLIIFIFSASSTLTLAKTSFSDEIVTSDQKLSLCSTAKIKAYSMIHVGYSALYMENCENRNQAFLDRNKFVSFHYDRAIPKRAFIKSTLKTLKKNLSTEEMQKWQAEIEDFNSNYEDVAKGDQYDICYITGEGLKLYLNDKLIASNNSDEFASLYFKVWFGEEPFNDSLKNQLLSTNKLSQKT